MKGIFIGLFAAVCLGATAIAKTPLPAETPNVIFILMDDMGYSDLYKKIGLSI